MGSDRHLKLILQIAAGVVLGGIVLVVLSLVLTLAFTHVGHRHGAATVITERTIPAP